MRTSVWPRIQCCVAIAWYMRNVRRLGDVITIQADSPCSIDVLEKISMASQLIRGDMMCDSLEVDSLSLSQMMYK